MYYQSVLLVVVVVVVLIDQSRQQCCGYDKVQEGCNVDLCGPTKLMGGTQVLPILNSSQFPYMVSLQTMTKPAASQFQSGCFKHFCGGTMITASHVLTAAHCFDDFDLVGPQSIWLDKPVYAAIRPNCRHLNGDKYPRMEVDEVFIHPNYSQYDQNGGKSFVSDVAVVSLLPEKGTFYDGPVAQVDDSGVSFNENSKGYVIGYGEVRPAEKGRYIVYPIHGATLDILSEDLCREFLSDIDSLSASFLDYQTMFCAYNVFADTCKGDSGGPLFLQNQDIQSGIVSWGPASQCSSTGQLQAPAVFTRVSVYASWIKSIISQKKQQQQQPRRAAASIQPQASNVVPQQVAPPPPITEATVSGVEEKSLSQILLDFRSKMKDPSGFISSFGSADFNQSNPCQNWSGIMCEDGAITSISIHKSDVQTSIPQQFCLLTSLTQIDLYNSKVTGTVPKELSLLKNLQKFRLSQNQLSGTLSPTFSSWSNMQSFYVEDNKLTGMIPVEYSRWSNVRRIFLQNNNFSGSITEEFSAWTDLSGFVIQQNKISGTLPIQYSQFEDVFYFRVFPQQGSSLCTSTYLRGLLGLGDQQGVKLCS